MDVVPGSNFRKPPVAEKVCAELLKALADEIRLKILHSLFDREKCVGDLMQELQLAQPHVSHHLKVLKTARLVDSCRQGHKICYALHPEVRKRLSPAGRETLDLGCCEVLFKQ